MTWETVIGLEVHTQLLTKTKIFSAVGTAYGAPPNTQAGVLDAGLPGTLPVLNKKAVELALRFGLAVESEIPPVSVFSRKNYFYPDLPKGYQVSQFDLPILTGGHVNITLNDGSEKRINLTRAHLEEDAGKSVHDAIPNATGVDLNRSGMPLLEIVSEPDMRSAEEAVAYLKTLHHLVCYLGVSDGNMQEGSFRCDVNVSIRKKGETKLGTRSEVKNINSFRFVEGAIKFEVARQIELLERGESVKQETRLYDSNKGTTRAMRSKENAHDYRYFPEPDLLPLKIDQGTIEAIKSELPELPSAVRARFQKTYHLSAYDANLLTSTLGTTRYFEAVVKAGNNLSPKLIANWINGDLNAALNKASLEITQVPISAKTLVALLQRIEDKTISNTAAKQVFTALWNGEAKTADEYINANGLEQITDDSALEQAIDKIIMDFPNQVSEYRSGKDKLFGFFVGQAMKATRGKGDPQRLNSLLKEKLSVAQ